MRALGILHGAIWIGTLALGCAAETQQGGSPLDDYAMRGFKGDGENGPQSCPDRQPELRREVEELLVALERNDRPEIDSVDAFVAALPQDVRTNLIFFTDTRAMQRIYPFETKQRLTTEPQGPRARVYHDNQWCSTNQAGDDLGCVEARVILQSRDGDVIASVVTHPNSPSRGAVELAMFDPSVSKLTLIDARFEDGQRTIARNPVACMGCHSGHDGQVNWRMDPYRFWAYVTPFAEDFLRPGSVEAEWYLSFLKRIEDGEEVLGRLTPFNRRADIEAALADDEGYHLSATRAEVNFAGRDSPALNLSHQLLEKNGCRTAAALAQREDFGRLQYAAAGALRDCENLGDFFPSEGSFTQPDADTHFIDRGLELGGRSVLEALTRRNVDRQASMQSDRLSRRFDHFAEFAGDTVALAELRGAMEQDPADYRTPEYGLSNFEIFAQAVAKAQYMLEPLGVDVSNWSMAVDPETQSHVEFFTQISRRVAEQINPFTQQPLSRMSCEELAVESRRALTGFEPADLKFTVDSPESLEMAAIAMAQERTREQLDNEVAPIYRDSCATCHNDRRDYAEGAPFLPFSDMTQLAEAIARERTSIANELRGENIGTPNRDYPFEYVTLGDRIWDRITRHPLQYGMMPRDEDPLPREAKVALRAHIFSVLGSAPGGGVGGD